MAATLTTLRIGEAVTVRGRPVNSDGTQDPVLLKNVSWGGNDAGIATVVQDGGDDYLAEVTGVAPGTTAAHMFAEDAFTVHDDEAAVTVLNASRFLFSVGAVLLEPDPTFASITGAKVRATPWDVRDDPIVGDIYPVDDPDGIHDILWTSANGAVLFGGTEGTGTATLAGSLVADIYPDTTSGHNEATTDVITITAKNSQGQTISSTLNVTIRRTSSVSIELVVE